ncbi:MAG: hypothetical protein ABSD38_24360 [Syntrophorhabdales bacterium]|jgi:hypothetical protein
MKKLIVLSLVTLVMVIGGTLNPPKAVPAEPTVAKSAEEIVGTWFTNDSFFHGTYVRFDKDGTSRWATATHKLDSQPYAINSYEFKGTEMLITEVSVSGVPSCGKVVGHYQVQLLEHGNIRLVAIDDPSPRAGNLPGEYKPVR